jgi:hypothetical protein
MANLDPWSITYTQGASGRCSGTLSSIGRDGSRISALLADADLIKQEDIRHSARKKEQSSENSYGAIDSKLTKVMASLIFLVLPLLSFYYIKTAIDGADGFGKLRFSIGITLFLIAHLFGLYVLLPILGLTWLIKRKLWVSSFVHSHSLPVAISARRSSAPV